MSIAYPDYGNVHTMAPGVLTATLDNAAGTLTDAAVKLRRLKITTRDLLGRTSIRLTANDHKFRVYVSTITTSGLEVVPGATLTIGSDVYRVVDVETRADGKQADVFARKQ